METLGQVLRNKTASDAAAAAARVMREQSAAEEKRKADREATVELFEGYKDRIITSIRDYSQFPAIELRTPREESNHRTTTVQVLLGIYEEKTRIDTPLHPNHDVWLAFVAWARESELSVSICYNCSDECNEAGPEESWYELQGVAV
jgi:hypothetical protein